MPLDLPGPKGFRRLPPVFLLTVLAMSAGCTREGTVRVTNSTEHDVVVQIMQGPNVAIPPGGELVEPVKISKGIFPPSEREIEVSGLGVVVNAFTARLVIGNGEEGHVPVVADAAALIIINELECSLREVFVKGCGVGQWGGNRLSTPVRPEASRVLRFAPGCYDARLVSVPCPEDPFARIFEGRMLEVGKTDTLRFRLTGVASPGVGQRAARPPMSP